MSFHVDFKRYFTYGEVMASPLQLLEERVSAVTERLTHLRSEVRRLQGLLEACERPARTDADAAPAGSGVEIRRLREERARIRARIRAMIQEIDRAL
jgi:hypothetical protein